MVNALFSFAAEAPEWCTVPGSSALALTTQNCFSALREMDEKDGSSTGQPSTDVIVVSDIDETDYSDYEVPAPSPSTESVIIVSSDPDDISRLTESKSNHQKSVYSAKTRNLLLGTTSPSTDTSDGSSPLTHSKSKYKLLTHSRGVVSSDSDESNPDPNSRPNTFVSLHRETSPIPVTVLPFNIDGDMTYKLPYNPEKRMQSSKDGRPGKTCVTSSRKGLAGIRRLAHCKGSFKCYSAQCPYRKQYGCANRTQFEREGSDMVCKCCGLRALSIDCPAVKVWEFPSNSSLVTVIHSGKHTCVAIPKPIALEQLKKLS